MERLQVLLELVTGQYKREAKEAAVATQQIGTSAKTAGTDTTKSLQGANQALSGFKALAAGAAVGAVIAFGKQSVQAASNLEESMNAVNVQFGEASEGILALGEDSATSFGMSQRAFNEFAVRFSAFAENIAQSSGRSVVDVVEEMTTRIADFASVHNLTMEEASTIAQSTLAGETEAFRRFGGDVSAAAVELKGMELGLGDTSAELSEQEKILIRYELFMEQTAKTAGDFANTSDSLANQQKILTANFEEFQAMLGQVVVPLVAESIGQFNELLEVISLIADVLPGVEGGTASFGSAIGNAFDSLNPFSRVLEVASAWLTTFKNEQEKAEKATAATTTSMSGGVTVLEAYNDAAAPIPGLIDTLTFSQETGTTVMDAYNDMAREGQRALDDNSAAIEANIAALDAHQDKIRAQSDPMFALLTATRDQAKAQDAVTKAQDEFGKGSPEHIDALADLAISNLDLRDAQAEARVATNLTKDAFIDQQVAAGTARDAAQQLADVLYGLSGLRLDPIQLMVEIRELRRSGGTGGYQEYHQGGVVQGDYIGQEVMAKLQVGEVVTPIGQAPSAALATATMGGGVNIENLYAMGTSAQIAHDIGQEVSLALRLA